MGAHFGAKERSFGENGAGFVLSSHEGHEGHEGHEKKSSRCKNKTKQNKEKDDGLFMVCVH